jgi:hypothetical protein
MRSPRRWCQPDQTLKALGLACTQDQRPSHRKARDRSSNRCIDGPRTLAKQSPRRLEEHLGFSTSETSSSFSTRFPLIGKFIVPKGKMRMLGRLVSDTRTPASVRLRTGVADRAKGNLVQEGMIVIGGPLRLSKTIQLEVTGAPVPKEVLQMRFPAEVVEMEQTSRFGLPIHALFAQ